MKASSRNVGVLGGGVGGFLVGGPAGAGAGGIAGGLAMDGITTGIESAVKHEYTPAGSVRLVTNIIENKGSPGDEFDLVVGTLLDGYVGRKSGKNKASLSCCNFIKI